MTGRRRPRLSQHFLHDTAVAARISDALRAPEGARVLEIGAGEGALTEHLIGRGWKVLALELDERLARNLASRWSGRDDLHVVAVDALEFALPAARGPWWVIGNLPYAVTTPLLFNLVDSAPRVPVREMVFMVQREVAERLAAQPGTGAMGSLTVGIRLVSDVEWLFDVGPGAFRPPPRVRSSVIRIVPHDRWGLNEKDRERLRRLVQTLFGQRRKQLQKGLRTLSPWRLARVETERMEEETGLDLSRRPETLSVEEWLRLESALGRVLAERQDPSV